MKEKEKAFLLKTKLSDRGIKHSKIAELLKVSNQRISYALNWSEGRQTPAYSALLDRIDNIIATL